MLRQRRLRHKLKNKESDKIIYHTNLGTFEAKKGAINVYAEIAGSIQDHLRQSRHMITQCINVKVPSSTSQVLKTQPE